MPAQRFIIYCITCCVNGKQYVGQTRYSLEHRWSGHITGALRKKQTTALGHAIRKYGRNAFIIEKLVETRSHAAADRAEVLWIKKRNSRSPHGYNLTAGGESPEMHPSTRQKISASWRCPQKKKKRAQKIRDAWAGKSKSERDRIAAVAKAREDARSPKERAKINRKISARVKDGLKALPESWHQARKETVRQSTQLHWDSMTAEERHARVAPMRAARSPTSYIAAVKASAARPPVERRASAVKAWQTKRERYGATPGLYVRHCGVCGKPGHYSTSCEKRKSL